MRILLFKTVKLDFSVSVNRLLLLLMALLLLFGELNVDLLGQEWTCRDAVLSVIRGCNTSSTTALRYFLAIENTIQIVVLSHVSLISLHRLSRRQNLPLVCICLASAHDLAAHQHGSLTRTACSVGLLRVFLLEILCLLLIFECTRGRLP